MSEEQDDADVDARDYRHRRLHKRLPFAPFDRIDIVDAAPIPVGVNFGATRHRQMIEQGGQGAFRTAHSQ